MFLCRNKDSFFITKWVYNRFNTYRGLNQHVRHCTKRTNKIYTSSIQPTCDSDWKTKSSISIHFVFQIGEWSNCWSWARLCIWKICIFEKKSNEECRETGHHRNSAALGKREIKSLSLEAKTIQKRFISNKNLNDVAEVSRKFSKFIVNRNVKVH